MYACMYVCMYVCLYISSSFAYPEHSPLALSLHNILHYIFSQPHFRPTARPGPPVIDIVSY